MSKLKFLVGGVLTALTLVAAAAYAAERPAGPAPAQSSELVHLAAGSELAVVGRVVNTAGVARRLSKEELARLDDLGKTLGGTLYTLQVEEVVIKRADFASGESPPPLTREVLVFKKRDAPYSPNELYVKGRRYLIFLRPIPGQNQLPKEYQLDAGRTYYQAFDPGKGIVPLTNDSPPLLVRLRQLGGAVKPDDPQQKLKRLRALTQSNDEELRQAAKEAIRLIQERLRR